MHTFDLLRLLFSLLFVIGLIVLTAWVLRRYGARALGMAASAPRSMRIVEVLPIDARHRIVKVAHNGNEHLILLGAGGNLVLNEMPRAVAGMPKKKKK